MASVNHSLFHADHKSEPYWWEAARPDNALATDPPDRTEILVVGSGYSSLSAALDLARAGRAVTIAEAETLGWAASSRNGGCVSAGINLGKGIAGGQGDKQNNLHTALLRESLASYEYVIGLIKRESINCHLEQRGRFIGAFAASHFPDLAEKAAKLNDLINLGAKVVSREQQRAEIGTDFYHGGMSIKRAAKLHPSLYYKGLLEVCAEAGVTLSAETRVDAIDGTKGHFTAKTSKGDIAAEQVIIATNGYTGPLTPKLRKRLVPISSQIIVTEELPDDMARELIPAGRTISETPRITSYYRLTPGDRRVMYGGRARFHSVPPKLSATILHDMMTARWPQLKDAKITHSWSGFVAMTSDSLPHMGEEDGLHYCMGCNGSGIAMMTYMGHMVAQRILAEGQSDSIFFELDFPGVPVPFYSGHPWFLPAVGGYFRLRDRIERGS